MSPLETIIRTLAMLGTLLVLTRLVGKTQVSQLTYFQYVTGITIGSIAAATSSDSSIELVDGVTSLVTWTAAILLLGFIAMKSRWADKILQGEPTVVVYKGRVLEDVMSKMPNYQMTDLWTQLREKGVVNITDVEVAVLETSGQLSVIKSADAQPPTARDMAVTPSSPTGLPMEIIVEGKIIKENLPKADISEEALLKSLNQQGIKDVKNVFYASMQPDGTIYVDPYKDKVKPVDPTDYKHQLEKL